MSPLSFVSFAGYATAATADGMPQWLPVVLGVVVLAGVVVLSIVGKKRNEDPNDPADSSKPAEKDARVGEDSSTE